MPNKLRSNTTLTTSTALKRFACAVMLLDHIGAAYLEAGLGIPYISIFNLPYLSQFGFALDMPWLIILDSVLRTIGRLAMPIFAYFLVEGFLHTKNASHYLLRLVCFGLISEPFFDFAFYKQWYYPAHQNIYATLALGLIGMMLLRKLHARKAKPHSAKEWGITAILCAGVLAVLCVADMLYTDYGSTGVLLILLLYLLRAHKSRQNFAFVLCTLWQFPAPLALIPLSQYDGTRGRCARWEQWVFYAFYPAHLCVLGVIAHCIL
ncbi:MAG: TraX family protein [Faecalibacterium sp.]